MIEDMDEVIKLDEVMKDLCEQQEQTRMEVETMKEELKELTKEVRLISLDIKIFNLIADKQDIIIDQNFEDNKVIKNQLQDNKNQLQDIKNYFDKKKDNEPTLMNSFASLYNDKNERTKKEEIYNKKFVTVKPIKEISLKTI